jgi:hypothetical protein
MPAATVLKPLLLLSRSRPAHDDPDDDEQTELVLDPKDS